MKKWSEIKDATLAKLFLTPEEADQQGYLKKFQYLANEALNIIANGVKPKIAIFSPNEEDDGVVIEDVGVIQSMPDDFLSFADIPAMRYDLKMNGNGVMEKNGEVYHMDPEIVYVGDRNFMVTEKGFYVIYYNALWDEITKDNVDSGDDVLPIDQAVLNCLPTYIASQVLAQDDIQRSAILKNEFELMLARLDTNIMYESRHYRSTGGWY